MWTASIRVDGFSNTLLQPLTSSANLVVIGIDFISSGSRISGSLLPPGGREEAFFCFATTTDTRRVMRIVDGTEIASDLAMVNESVRLRNVHIYLSPPTRYTCLIRSTVLVIDSIRIHRIHASVKYKAANRALCRLYQRADTPPLTRRLSIPRLCNVLDRNLVSLLSSVEGIDLVS